MVNREERDREWEQKEATNWVMGIEHWTPALLNSATAGPTGSIQFQRGNCSPRKDGQAEQEIS